MTVLGMSRTRRAHPQVDRSFDATELLTVLPEADCVTLWLLHTPETTRIIDAATLHAMKASAY